MDKHPFYQGIPLPLESMNDNDFNSFIIACSDYFFPNTISDTSFPDTHDNGFDLRRRVSGTDNQYICIQSKKMQAIVDYSTISKELCKVALASKYYNLIIKEYYLFSVKGANSKWCSDNEVKRKEELINYTKDHLKKEKLFIDIRKKLQSIGVYDNELFEVVQKFINTLDNIVICKQDDIERMIKKGDNKDFDNIISNFFIVNKMSSEVNPRPDYDEDKYFDHATNVISGILKQTIELELYKDINNDLMHSNPMYDQNNVSESAVISYQEFLNNLQTGTVFVITAKGGYGKTISTAYIFNKAIELHRNDTKRPIPVLIECKSYFGKVCDLINRRLGLSHGSFYQIGASFLLIFDAIDELPQSEVKNFFAELSILIDSYPISLIITQRNNTLNSDFIMGKSVCSYGIMQLSIRQMYEICILQKMNYEESKEMIFKYIETYKDTEILYSPFIFVKTIEFYRANMSLPKSALSLLEFYISTRFNRNKYRISYVSNSYSTNDIAETFITIAKHMLLSGDSSIDLTEVQQICKKISSDLSREEFMAFLTNFEIMDVVDGICSFQHQILAYYFGSFQIKPDQLISLFDDGKDIEMLIILSLSRFTLEEAIYVIQHLCQTDLILASKCALIIGDDAVNTLLPTVEAKYKSNRLFDIWEATTSYGILKSPSSCKMLLDDFNSEEKVSFKKSNIKRALLMMGEESQSLEVLNETEQNYAIPLDITITPNPWNYIPINVRYRLAQERIESAICDNFTSFNEFKNGFCFSMQFIYYTIPTDDIVQFCKSVINATPILKSLRTFYIAFFIVLRDDNPNDIPYLKDMLNRSLKFAEHLEILIESYKLGYILFDDADVLNIIEIYNQMSCEEQIPSSSSNTLDTKQIREESRKHRNLDTISKIESFLDLIDLSEGHLTTIFSYFDKNLVLKKRSFIWLLLGKYKYQSMHLLIPSVIENHDIDTCALATLYLKESEASELFLDEYKQLLSEEPDRFFSYDLRLLLKHLEHNGRVDDVLSFITPRLYAGFHLGDIVTDYHDLRDPHTQMINREVGLLTYLEMYLSNCLNIDNDILRAFIKDYELLVFSEDRNMVGKVLPKLGLKELTLAIENKEIAMVPHLIKAVVQTYGEKTNVAIIGEEIFKTQRLSGWEKVLDLIWNDSTILSAIDRLIYESSLPLDTSEISQLQDLNGLVTKQQAESIIGPLLNSNRDINDIARRTLELWYDVGIRKKS
ncbi:MAG: hypothetical protein ABFC98_00615 [Candidatus Cloacimonas sp.]